MNMKYSYLRRKICNLKCGVLNSAGLVNMQTFSNLVFTLWLGHKNSLLLFKAKQILKLKDLKNKSFIVGWCTGQAIQ